MGLLASIKKMRLGLGGTTPDIMPGSLPSSKLHNTSSVNGSPALKKGVPSILDLDGKNPAKYLDNPPT